VSSRVSPFSPPPWKARIVALRGRMAGRSLDGLLITDLFNIRYLCGFSGSHGLLVVTPRKSVLLTDARYRLQTRSEVRNAEVTIVTGDLYGGLSRAVRFQTGSRLGFEEESLTVARLSTLRAIHPAFRFVPAGGLVEKDAAVKDSGEIACIREAARIADGVFRDVVEKMQPGITEHDVAAGISAAVRRRGGDGDAFDIIVASGAQGAFPHARASHKLLVRGEFVIMDFGVRFRGYNSDLTRTVALGRIDARQRAMYDAVREAHDAAVSSARTGIPARDLDALARNVIRRHGFGHAFVHSLGHGLGLRIHERPRVAPLSGDTLASGNVITIEPGIYLRGVGGVRIEDDVLIRAHGCTMLTRSPKELLIV
jgi:Xaa-Pro aminopeptidase